jgi:hypothetical protein
MHMTGCPQESAEAAGPGIPHLPWDWDGAELHRDAALPGAHPRCGGGTH